MIISEQEKKRIRELHLSEQNIGGWFKNIFKKNKGADEVEDQEVIDIVEPRDKKIPFCRDTDNYGRWEDASPYKDLPMQERPIGGASLMAVNDVSLVYGYGLWGDPPTTWLYVEKDGRPICKILEMDQRRISDGVMKDFKPVRREKPPIEEIPPVE